MDILSTVVGCLRFMNKSDRRDVGQRMWKAHPFKLRALIYRTICRLSDQSIALRWVGERSDDFLGGAPSNKRVPGIIFELTGRERCQTTVSSHLQVLDKVLQDSLKSGKGPDTESTQCPPPNLFDLLLVNRTAREEVLTVFKSKICLDFVHDIKAFPAPCGSNPSSTIRCCIKDGA